MISSSMNKYASFDIETFLSEYEIDYKSSGKNIGRNWIGIKYCPFCNDDRFHCGINLISKKVNCFVCGETSLIPRFIKEKLNLSDWKEIFRIVNNFKDGEQVYVDIRQSGNNVIFPSEISEIKDIGIYYLSKRNFNWKKIKDKYQIKMTNHTSYLDFEGIRSDFKWRIIIPIIMNRELVSYTGRDYTNQRNPKYQHPFLEASKLSTASCIYNYDTLKENGIGIIVEGPTDVWRLGDNSIAMMGVKYTKKQISLLAKKKLKKIFIVFDEGAQRSAKDLANAMIGLSKEINIVDIGGGDIGELPQFDAISLKEQLLKG